MIRPVRPLAFVVVTAFVALAPRVALAQGARLQLDALSALAAKATEKTDISLDAATLQLASGFLSDEKADPDLKSLLAGVKAIVVKNFTFAADYDRGAVNAVRQQLARPGWSSLVKQESPSETVDVYLFREGDQFVGVAIIAAEARELTVVNIVGPIDLAKLAKLQGSFGIAKLPVGK